MCSSLSIAYEVENRNGIHLVKNILINYNLRGYKAVIEKRALSLVSESIPSTPQRNRIVSFILFVPYIWCIPTPDTMVLTLTCYCQCFLFYQ